MLAHLSSYEDLIRLAVFMGLGLVFWGLSMAFPLDGMAIQRIRFFDAWFIFVALALAGVAEAVLLPLVILMQQEVTLAMRYWQFQDITWNSPVKLLCCFGVLSDSFRCGDRLFSFGFICSYV